MIRNAVFGLIFTAGLISWGAAQATQGADFARKSRQELEIMKGILQTTLNFVVQDLRQRESGGKAVENRRRMYWGSGPELGAFYLQGQGAVFMISASDLRMRVSGREERLDEALEEGLEAQEALREAVTDQEEALRALSEAGVGVPAPPQPPQPPQAVPAPAAKPAQPAVSSAKQEEMRKRLAEAQARMKQRREELQARQKKLQEYLDEIKVHLVEALANHGDSLTTIKPSEYINVIIGGDGVSGIAPTLDSGDASSNYQVISVQKSLIADYRAGKLSLDAFRQKVLQYNN
jgi:hypothetical protein